MADTGNIQGCTSLIEVLCTGGSEAVARYYRAPRPDVLTEPSSCQASDAELIQCDDRDLRDFFEFDCESRVFIGRNGTGKVREGDARTPLGDFHALSAFGIKPNPGTQLPYIRVTDTTYACDSDCPFYNRIIERIGNRDASGLVPSPSPAPDAPAPAYPAACPGCDRVSCGERMIDEVPAYNYGIALDYNPENIYPKGSAIFFHCKSGRPYTGGCVAADEDFVLHVLQTCGPRPLFRIMASEAR